MSWQKWKREMSCFGFFNINSLNSIAGILIVELCPSKQLQTLHWCWRHASRVTIHKKWTISPCLQRKNGNALRLVLGTYSLCTKWFRRSWVISSCQLFLMPVAEGGPAVGMDPTPLASLIRLRERARQKFNDLPLQIIDVFGCRKILKPNILKYDWSLRVSAEIMWCI